MADAEEAFETYFIRPLICGRLMNNVQCINNSFCLQEEVDVWRQVQMFEQIEFVVKWNRLFDSIFKNDVAALRRAM
jgi:hypothetical protein